MPRIKDEFKIHDIHAAALKLAVTQGFIGLKMADVARAAGIATGTVYLHYTSKEELINALYIETKSEIIGTLTNPQHVKETPYLTLKSMWYAYIHFCISQPQKMMFTEQFRYSGIVSPQIIDDMEQKMVSLKELLIKMQQGGIIKENDPDIILAQFKGPIHEIVKLNLHKNITLNEDILEKCYQMAWNSIKQ